MPMSRLLVGTFVMSWPPTTTRPASASSSPASSRSAVVLPQPDGPSSATSSPGAMGRSSPSRARTAPKLRRRSVRRTATPGGAVVRRIAAVGGHVSSPCERRRGGRCRRRTGEQQHEREHQRGKRHGDRDRGVALAEQVDRDLQVVAVEQAGDGELAEDQRHRQERRRAGRRCGCWAARPATSRWTSSRRGSGPPRRACDVDRATARRRARGRRRGAPGRRTRSDSADGGAAEEVGHPGVDRRQADHQHDRRNGQRQQADELDRATQPGQPQPHPGHRRDEQEEHDRDGEHGQPEPRR